MLVGCGKNTPREEDITTRIVDIESVNIKKGVNSQERFDPRMNVSGPLNSPAAAPLNLFAWTTPEGWDELAPAPMRMINFRIAGNEAAQCYLTILTGTGGGKMDNINRWRTQMSLPQQSQEEVAKLPTKKLLGHPAAFVDFSGTFHGMNDATPKEGYRLMGLILEYKDASIFVKMIGPATVLSSELKNFELFYSSLRLAGKEKKAENRPEVERKDQTLKNKFSWKASEGWNLAPDRFSRLVSYTMGLINQTECYITVLPSTAGGVMENINRWQRQMGQTALSSEEVEKIPTIEMFGLNTKLVEITGDYTGMSGSPKNGFMLLGVVCPLQEETIFVKMIGPESDVQEERENFIKFCKSVNTE